MTEPLSWWFADLHEAVVPRPALGGDLAVDVAIVGAGYTGLWTAYELSGLDPTLRIAVLERDVAGAGASGRNGGWCSALFPTSWERVAAASSRSAALAMHQALAEAVDEVGWVATGEGIDARFAKGGTLTLARCPAQLARLRSEVAAAHAFGFGEDDVRLLSAADARARIDAAGVLGAAFTPHCAALHPGRLVRGLAAAVERRGVALYERTPVTSLAPRRLRTAGGATVHADVVVRATEAYTSDLPGYRRALLPLYSLMVVTDPLPAAAWETIGWRDRETVTDGRHLIVYAQRTADDRIAFGGRGAPYHFGSRIRPEYDRVPAVFDALTAAVHDLVPAAREVGMAARWGGALAAPRDWFPSVGFDRACGLAWGGGYVGDGVAASNLAGRTLADLILGRETALVRLPWVNHRSPRWEPEPLRWLGVTAATRGMAWADTEERWTDRPSRVAGVLERVLGI